MTFFKFPKFGKRKNRPQRKSAFRRMMNIEGLENRQLLVSDVSIVPLDAIKFEGLNGTNTNFTFTVSRVNDLTSTATVTYSRLPNVPGNGIDFNDFLGSTSNITFLANQTSQVLTVTVVGDRDVEADEVFRITLVTVPGGNANVVGSPATGTILNDDTDWVLALPTPSLAEGSVGASTPFPLTITRIGYVGVAMNINYATAASGVNPANAADFVGGFASGVANFAIGEVTKTINVAVAADRVIEPNETYDVSISNAPASTDINVGGPLTQTILNDDIDITLSPTTNSVTEGHTNNPTLVYTLTRSGSGVPVVVNFAVTGHGANPANGADFVGGVLPTGSVSFAANETTKTFTLTIQSDRDVEPNEDFKVTVTSVDTNVDFINDNTISTIVNDDVDFFVAALDANKNEGSGGGNTPFTFTVSRIGLMDAISVDYSVSGSGVNPADNLDFQGDVFPTATLNFAAGEVSKTISIPVKPDRNVEADEGFSVALAVSGNADDASGPATGSIGNDDTDYSFATANYSQAEGSNNSATDFLFTVSRTGLLDANSIDFTVTGSGASPADGLDFAGGILPSGTISFASGESSKTVTLSVLGDRDVEANEQFRLTLVNPPALQDIVGGTRVLTVTNDDVDYALSPLSSTNAEGQSSFVNVIYQLTRIGTLEPASFSFTVVGTGANPADAADFFNGVLPSGTINFGLNSPLQNITVRLAGDRLVELDETYELQLTEVVANPNADFGQMFASGTIVNDDVDMSIIATDASKDEGNVSPNIYTFTATRSGVLDVRTTNWAVTGSGTNPSDAADFVGGVLPSGVLNWSAGQSTQLISVVVQGDETPEADEGFTVTLSNAGLDVDLGPSNASGSILNDEATLFLSAIDNVKIEGNSGNTPFLFLITRTGNLTRATTGTWTTTGSGTNQATPPGDVTASGTFSFTANQTQRIITVMGKGDRTVELDETFTVSLALTGVNAQFQQIADGTESATILNDDVDVTITTTTASQFEGTMAGDRPYVFTVNRAGNPSEAFSVDYTVTGNGGTAASAADFATPMNGTVSFAAGEMSKTITLMTVADRDVEPNEGFRVTLSNAVPATNVDVSTLAALGIINNDDADFTLAPSSANSANRAEGNTGTVNFTFTLTRVGYRPAITGIPFSVSPTGTHPANTADFTPGVFPSGTVNMGLNGSTVVISVPVKGDTTVEFTETFLNSVVVPPEYDLLVGSATGTIVNDELAYGIFPVNNNGTAEDTEVKVYTIQRFGALTTAGSVRYSVVGTGTNPVDATDFGGTLPNNILVSFPIGVSSVNITIDPSTDTAVEADEDFNVVLSSPLPINLQLSPSTASGTILNDDLEISNIDFALDGAVSIAEGNASTTSFNFVLTRSGVTTNTTVVNYSVVGSGVNPANSIDFNGGVLPAGSVTFGPGETTKALSILVNGDLSVEGDEGFTVQLSAPYQGTILNTPSLDRTILNDDQQQFSISAINSNSNEGNTGTSAFAFSISRIDGSGTYTLNWSAAGSGVNAANGSDFSGLVSGSVFFDEGETTKNITVLVNGDRDVETDETFDVTISGGAAIYVVPSATATIVSEDMDVAMTSSGIVGFEGTLSAGSFTFTVQRTGASSEAFSVDYLITGTGLNPVNAADFTGGVTGTISFASGEMTKLVTLPVVNDRDVEQDEAFTLTLANISSTNADLSTNAANGQLTNDDTDYSVVAVAQSIQTEGNSGSKQFRFSVLRTGYLPADSVSYAVTGTGANPTNAADFSSVTSGTLTFAAGIVGRTIFLNVVGDTTVEADEDFLASITVGSQFDVIANNALGRILNDD